LTYNDGDETSERGFQFIHLFVWYVQRRSTRRPIIEWSDRLGPKAENDTPMMGSAQVGDEDNATRR